ncbi:hypothetical protein [Promicromonospora sukumoe]|uniref:hypothetical protein n=1 Tax=Promicromonospora sukumoe TaxID=88382 RepID=UPI00364F6BE6
MSKPSPKLSPRLGGRVLGSGRSGPPRGGAGAGWALGLSIAGLVLIIAAPPVGPWVALAGIVVTVLELVSGDRGQRVVAASVLSGFSVLFLGIVVAFVTLA